MNSKSNLLRVLSVFLVISSFAAFAFGAKALSVQEKLEKGQSLYEAGDYDGAMDNFLDVFVEGNIEQINIANEYVNMIHFKRGGVSTPTRVVYDEGLEAQKEAYKQEAKDLQQELANEYDTAKTTVKDTAKNTEQQIQADLEAKQQEVLDLQAQEQAKLLQAQEDARLLQAQEQERLNQQLMQAQQDVNDIQEGLQEQVTVVSTMPANYEEEEPQESESSEVIIQDQPQYTAAQRDAQIARDITDMQEKLIAKLNSLDGVNVYMRNGKVDAIDIDSDVIFLNDNITFSSNGKAVLEDVYALMLLAKEPVFVLLPPGSYTDEVDLQGVRQTVALNSYLINRGLSSAKLNFNMGLVNEQPPAKFSNLEGVSIVFDYDNKPQLYNKLSDKQAYPILSLGMYPEKINTSLGEGMVIDFSVIETAAPIEEWKLQIIQHALDGKYYVVRQVSGKKEIYDQIFWNGRKQFYGEALPAGKYTLMLRAKDNKGREKIVRRKVEIVAQAVKEETAQTAKTAKTSKAVKQAALDYSTPRLWKKPAKILKKQNAVNTEVIDVSEEINTNTNSSKTETVEVTTTVTTNSSTTTTKQTNVVNPSASPEQDGLAYDPTLEDLL